MTIHVQGGGCALPVTGDAAELRSRAGADTDDPRWSGAGPCPLVRLFHGSPEAAAWLVG
jgi:hypothetical protein